MSDFRDYYKKQAQGIFSGPLLQKGYGQRGRGIGKMLKNFMSWITPIAKQHILPKLETGAKYVGSNFVQSVANLAQDVIQGKNLNEAAKERYDDLVTTIKNKAIDKLEGRGFKNRKRTTINKTTKKRKNYIILKPNSKRKKRASDIFDNI
jgi:hypothetical protein